MSDTDTTQDGNTDDAEGAKATEGEVKDWQAEADKWKALARKHEGNAKANADAAKRLAAIEDANKSDIEKATEAANAAEARAVAAERKALRYEVAADKGVPTKLMKFLHGDTAEELAASADELLAAVKPDTGEEGDAKGGTGRPQERLRSGASNDDADPDETDPVKLAAAIPRG